MPFSIRPFTGVAAFAALMTITSANANMGTIGNTYGLFPQDVATTQALSMFNQEVSAINDL